MAAHLRSEPRPDPRQGSDQGRTGAGHPRLTGLLLALLAAACSKEPSPTPAALQAGAAPGPAPTAAAGAPTEPFAFDVDPADIDLGIVRPDEDASFEFTIVNRDARPLRIANVDGSCDCTAFTWDRREIPVGGTRTVSVEVRAQNRGSKLITCWAQAADRAQTTKDVRIRYVVVPDLGFTPPRADFGKRVLGSSTTLTVTVRYTLPKDAEPIELAPKLAADLPITVRVITPPEVKKVSGGLTEVRSKIELVLDTSKPLLPFETELVFSGERHLPAKLVVTGTVHGGTYLDPEEIQLGVAAIGTTRRGTTRLFWTREQPKIEAIECDPAELKATAAAEQGARAYRIQVSFEPKTQGELDGTIRLRTNLAPEPLVLKVKGTVR